MTKAPRRPSRRPPSERLELSVVLPCLNEARTLAQCIHQARLGAERAGAQGAEIIIADNGSDDGSPEIARAEGGILVSVPTRGYGAALQAGIRASTGAYVVMGDSDGSYDLSEIEPFLQRLRQGLPLVIGSRFRGGIRPGAMPFLHRYLGNPILTAIANLLFRTRLSDYHCGLRAFDRQAIQSLDLRTTGMEFASEMIIRAAIAGLKIGEVPVTYSPAGRGRPPHLHTWRDGWRHLRFMLLYSPRWLFFYPGAALAALGAVLSTLLLSGPLRIGNVTLDVHTLLFAETCLVLGIQLILLGVFTRVYASTARLLPPSPRLEGLVERFSLGLGLACGVGVAALGAAVYLVGLYLWSQIGFGPIADSSLTLRIAITGTTLILLGAELFFGSFVVSLLRLQRQGSFAPVGEQLPREHARPT